MSGEFAKYEGNVMLGVIDPVTGIFSGYSQPIECNSFKPGRKAGSATAIRSKQRGGRYNGIINQTYAASNYSLEMQFVEIPSSVMAILFASNPVTINLTASTFTAQNLVVGALGAAYNTGHRNIKTSPPMSVKTTDGITTFALGTDYTIDTRTGLITILATGTITAGQTVVLAGSFDVLTGVQFDGETNPLSNAQVYFDGKNLETGTDIVMEYYNVQIPAPDNIMDLLSETPVSATLIGTPFTPSGKNAPYRVVTNMPTTAL